MWKERGWWAMCTKMVISQNRNEDIQLPHLEMGVPVPRRFVSLRWFEAVFFGRMSNCSSTRAVRGRGRLADFPRQRILHLELLQCSANISVLIRIEADHFALRDSHLAIGVSTENSCLLRTTLHGSVLLLRTGGAICSGSLAL